MDTCESFACCTPACVSYGGRSLCLSHFHAGGAAPSGAAPSGAAGTGRVLSAAQYAEQLDALQAMWLRVANEVASELTEGALEQRNDPLAFLATGLGPPPARGAAAKAAKAAKGKGAPPAPPPPPPPTGATAVGRSAAADDGEALYKRRRTRPTQMFTVRHDDGAAVAADGRDDGWFHSGVKCRACGSANTECDDMGAGNVHCTKAETWGNKDAEEQRARYTCRDCRTTWTEGWDG